MENYYENSISNYGNKPQKASLIFKALLAQGWQLSPERPGLCLQKPLPGGGMAYASFLPMQKLLRFILPLPHMACNGQSCQMAADFAWADFCIGKNGCFIGGLPDPYGAYNAAN